MTKLAFDTTVGPWTFDGVEYSGHFEDDKADAKLVAAANHAHSAGAVVVTEGLDLDTHVQSQEDGEAALKAAQGEWVERELQPDGTFEPGYWSGPWGEANAAQAAEDRASAATVGIEIEVEAAEEAHE